MGRAARPLYYMTLETIAPLSEDPIFKLPPWQPDDLG